MTTTDKLTQAKAILARAVAHLALARKHARDEEAIRHIDAALELLGNKRIENGGR